MHAALQLRRRHRLQRTRCAQHATPSSGDAARDMPRSVQRVACRSFGDGWAFSHLSVQLARYSGDGRGYVKVRATGIAARRGISHAAQE
jgi:hypothetical protein